MRQLAAVLSVGLLLVLGATLSAQETKPKTYTLVVTGAV
jgi:hypothetical protein